LNCWKEASHTYALLAALLVALEWRYLYM